MSKFIKAAVIGHPVKHSKSPVIHNYWIEKHGLSGSYEAVDIAPETFEADLRGLIEKGYTGFNFTVPHKEAALNICDTVSEDALAIGAVNTGIVRDGKLHGLNTDAFGFLANIETACPEFKFTAGPAVVLGAGGAARAVVNGLAYRNVPEIILINRTKEKAEKLAQDMNSQNRDLIRVVDWQDRENALGHANMLVNTTSLGMDGQPALDINLQNLPAAALVNDIVYAPLQTPLLKAAKLRGNPIVTGIGMLIHQARPAFKAWFAMMPDADEKLEALVLQ